MSITLKEAQKPRYAYSFWRAFYFVCLVAFVVGATLTAYIFVDGLFHERIYWKALVMFFACVLSAIGMWGRIRFPPKDPIFERE
jgi:hypothetical protein